MNNLMTKLQHARVVFQNKNVKKSGNNKFAGYWYYELSDIIPVLNTIMEEQKMIAVFSATKEMATLTIYNAEKEDDKMEFTLPMGSAQLKGCHEVQNIGAVQTYLKRYLYQNAFEIVENDSLDATMGKDTKPQETAIVKPTAQAKAYEVGADDEIPFGAPKCPKCGGELKERKGKFGAFMGCSNYPKCNYINKNAKGAQEENDAQGETYATHYFEDVKRQ